MNKTDNCYNTKNKILNCFEIETDSYQLTELTAEMK